MPRFDLERLANDMAMGRVRSAEFFIDAAHAGKPEHIDVHVFTEDGGHKYPGLSGVSELREQMPWLQPGQTVRW